MFFNYGKKTVEFKDIIDILIVNLVDKFKSVKYK